MRNILITREKSQFEEIRDLFLQHGLNPIPFPVIKFSELDFSFDQWEFDYVVFTSSNGVRFFFSKYRITKPKIIAVGQKTRQSLESLGYREIIVPLQQSSEGILNYILENSDTFKGKKVALIRALEGMNTLIDKKPPWLDIKLVAVYKTEYNTPENLDRVKSMLKNREIEVVVFSSPSSVDGFLRVVPQRELLEEVKVAVIGKTTLSKALKEGLKVDIKPREPNFEAIVKEILS